MASSPDLSPLTRQSGLTADLARGVHTLSPFFRNVLDLLRLSSKHSAVQTYLIEVQPRNSFVICVPENTSQGCGISNTAGVGENTGGYWVKFRQ